ncbi:hypothetical protein B0F90DRAFT_1758226, partial [Multifurca ochricompacta]
MKEVNKKIGQPPHKADMRFQVEGFLLSLELRYILADIARSRIAGLNAESKEGDVHRHWLLWRSYVSFIYDSCIRDAEKAVTIAKKSSASRLVARAGVYIVRGKLELFRFEILAERTLLSREGHFSIPRRRELGSRAEERGKDAAVQMRVLEVTYMRSRPATDVDEMRKERAWFVENCRERGEKYVKEYEALTKHFLAETVYEPLSLQEKRDIVRAFGFSPTGHFYNCENGHTFVIGDCGGAMELAKCPECKATVVGSSHRLHESNTRAMEYEDISYH